MRPSRRSHRGLTERAYEQGTYRAWPAAEEAMDRSRAVAHALSSAAGALAVVVIVGSTVGFGRAPAAPPEPAGSAPVVPVPIAVPGAEEPIVVFEEAPRRRHQEADEEHERREHHERRRDHDRDDDRDDDGGHDRDDD
jgi:hypothetical protein